MTPCETPCEKLGYQVGDEFVMKTDISGFKRGQRVTLFEDDGTAHPLLSGENEEYSLANGAPGAYVGLTHFEPAPTDRITLQLGDYVSTAGMTEEQYHAVAAAFMAAGCRRTRWDEAMRAEFGFWRYILWDCEDDIVGSRYSGEGRHLTIAQVLSATNATPEEPVTDTTIAALRLARARLKEAQGAYQLALDAVRAELGEGFVLVEVGEESVDDMSDPANWREGDLLECVDRNGHSWIKEGNLYPVISIDDMGWIVIVDDDGDKPSMSPRRFKFHSRPS